MPLDEVVSSGAAAPERGAEPAADLKRMFAAVRARSERLAAALTPEDWMIQSMPDASPVKWNLAHTSWFFETFILRRFVDGYRPFDEAFGYLFNSYYMQVGEMHPRSSRGLISRPSAEDVLAYRRHVTERIESLLESAPEGGEEDILSLVAIGCAHEEQHQELLLTDIKHGLFQNPTAPAVYPEPAPGGQGASQACDGWVEYDGGLAVFGAARGAEAPGAQAFDNEGPRHEAFLQPYALAQRLVTNAAYLAFMEDGGYEDPRWWLSDGWALSRQENWRAPLYWRQDDSGWRAYTLFGERDVDPDAPVSHLSYYEAAAYAEWSGFRLPSEFEWENAARGRAVAGDFLDDDGPYEPRADRRADDDGVSQLYGGVWEWTASPYVAYPGYRAPAGAIGEYNGKFMSSQMVLRGGSCATPVGHVRATYRNFFPPHARWQFSGLRLARDL